MKLLACSANLANLKRRFHWPNVAITRSACLGAKQENKSCRGSLKTKVLLLVHLVHVSGQRRQAATQERAVGVGLWGEGKRRYPCAPRRRGARPRRRELTGETRTLRGSKHDGLGETKAVGKKQRACKSGVLSEGAKGTPTKRVLLCRALFLVLSLQPISLENLVPGTGKAARLVALSQADPQLPMAGLVSPFSSRESYACELFFTTAK